MGLHKLTAGSGYDYLTRQVAALDATEKGHVGLAAYYAERGESPGASGRLRHGRRSTVWTPAIPVTAEQMRACSGTGCTHSPTPAGTSRSPTSRWTPSRRRCGSVPRSAPVDELSASVPGRGGEADR